MKVVPIARAKSDIRESDDPYDRLGDLAWLHNQETRNKVQMLLIDCFRLYHTRQLSRTADYMTYRKSHINRPSFRDFVQKAAGKEVLPSWWGSHDSRECVFMSMIRSSETSLELLRTEEEIEKDYDRKMPELLHTLACKIYGIGMPDYKYMKLLQERASTTIGEA